MDEKTSAETVESPAVKPFPRYHILINPSAKGGRGLVLWKKIEAYLKEKNIRYEVIFTKSSEHLRLVVEKLCEHKDSRLIVLGGDGTLNQVVTSITDFDALRVGYIPTGSGNDFARDLGLSSDPIDTLDIILRDETVHVFDVGTLEYVAQVTSKSDPTVPSADDANRDASANVASNSVTDNAQQNADKEPADKGFATVNKTLSTRPEETIPLTLHDKAPAFTQTRRFVVSSGIGFDAAVCEGVATSKAKRILGKLGLAKLVYLFIALKLILSNKNNPCSIIMDDNETLTVNKILFTAAFIHTYEGGGFPFAPDADASDGLFDICAAGDISNLTFLTNGLPLAMKGRHYELEKVHHYLCKKLEIITDKPLFVHTDGEVLAQSNHIVMRCEEKKLKMLM